MKRSTITFAGTLALGITVGAGMTGFLNAMQHAKVTELYKADLVTSEGKEASMFLAELAPGANMGKHYHPGDAFAYILEGTNAARDRREGTGHSQGRTERQPPSADRARRQERESNCFAEVLGVSRREEG